MSRESESGGDMGPAGREPTAVTTKEALHQGSPISKQGEIAMETIPKLSHFYDINPSSSQSAPRNTEPSLATGTKEAAAAAGGEGEESGEDLGNPISAIIEEGGEGTPILGNGGLRRNGSPVTLTASGTSPEDMALKHMPFIPWT